MLPEAAAAGASGGRWCCFPEGDYVAGAAKTARRKEQLNFDLPAQFDDPVGRNVEEVRDAPCIACHRRKEAVETYRILTPEQPDDL